MKKPKVCLGCFCEWETEGSVCPHCGWNFEHQDQTFEKWNVSDVLDSRYLVGKIYAKMDDHTVWRMYDNILGCVVWVIYGEKLHAKELAGIAGQLKEYVKILAIKQMDKREVLIFSMKEHFLDVETFKKWYEKDCKEDRFPTERGEMNQELPDKVLKEGICLDQRYKIKKCLGIGGFGITYLCEDILLHRDTAVKEYFPEQWAERDEGYVAVKKSTMLPVFQYGMKSFGKEIKITAKFIHTPHIVTVYDAFEENDTIYMAMEYINGISIGKEFRHRKYTPYTVEEMADIILPLLDALETIHANSIVHSDISPGNIIRTDKGDIVLIDMGAAKYALDSQPALSASFLKPEYAAPEQYQTAREGIPKGEGAWTDVYAVGAMMYYLLTGHKPVDVIQRLNSKNTDIAVMEKDNMELPEQWLGLIQEATMLDKNRRIRTAVILQKKIEKLLTAN